MPGLRYGFIIVCGIEDDGNRRYAPSWAYPKGTIERGKARRIVAGHARSWHGPATPSTDSPALAVIVWNQTARRAISEKVDGVA